MYGDNRDKSFSSKCQHRENTRRFPGRSQGEAEVRNHVVLKPQCILSARKDQSEVDKILSQNGHMDEDKDSATLTSSICLSMTCG